MTIKRRRGHSWWEDGKELEDLGGKGSRVVGELHFGDTEFEMLGGHSYGHPWTAGSEIQKKLVARDTDMRIITIKIMVEPRGKG